MKVSFISLAFTVLLFTSCDFNKSSIEKNCTSVIIKLHGKQTGFTILNIKTNQASEVKLALGKYDNETETIVNVSYRTDSLKEQYCTCLMDSNGNFITTSDKIEYD